MSKYLFLPFVGQYYNDNSFNISIINSCIYKGLTIPLIKNLKEDKKESIKLSGLKLGNGNNIKQLFENGGILTVKHPLINNNHSFLMIKDDTGDYVLVNSLMGPTILPGVSKEKIENVFNIVDGYYFIN